MDNAIFVQNIKYFCECKGEKPTVACGKSGVGTSFITDLNRGRVPSVAKVQKLAEYLGVTTSALLGEASENHMGISDADAQLLNAYHRADDRARSMVDLALEPFREKEKSSGAKVG